MQIWFVIIGVLTFALFYILWHDLRLSTKTKLKNNLCHVLAHLVHIVSRCLFSWDLYTDAYGHGLVLRSSSLFVRIYRGPGQSLIMSGPRKPQINVRVDVCTLEPLVGGSTDGTTTGRSCVTIVQYLAYPSELFEFKFSIERLPSFLCMIIGFPHFY